jgi:hypothetical protein
MSWKPLRELYVRQLPLQASKEGQDSPDGRA